jgi:uncharacterized protein
MFELFLASLIVMGVMVFAMAIGAIMGRKPLQGSCGGLGKIMGEDCEFCDDKDECPSEKAKRAEGTELLSLRVEPGQRVQLNLKS